MIPVTKPFIPDEKKYFKYVKQVNKSAWLTNFGPLHQELTHRLEEWLGVKNLLLVSNGTLALQIAYRALGLKGSVLTTPFSFIASSSSLVWEGLNPLYVDINKKNLGLDPKLLPKKPLEDTTGMLAVHVYGNPAETKSLDKYCSDHNLKMVYDGAHAFGIKKKGKSILLAGDATTLSLHATKVFHTIEGGAIIFKDKKHFDIAKQIINFGLNDSKEVGMLGINAKLNEYQAAVGLVLLDEVDKIIERRSEILDTYQSSLKKHLDFPVWDKDTNQNGAYAPVIFESEEKMLKVSDYLGQNGVQTRRYFHPSLNKIKSITKDKTSCPVSEDVAQRILCLPMYTGLTDKDQKYIIKHLEKSLKGGK